MGDHAVPSPDCGQRHTCSNLHTGGTRCGKQFHGHVVHREQPGGDLRRELQSDCRKQRQQLGHNFLRLGGHHQRGRRVLHPFRSDVGQQFQNYHLPNAGGDLQRAGSNLYRNSRSVGQSVDVHHLQQQQHEHPCRQLQRRACHFGESVDRNHLPCTRRHRPHGRGLLHGRGSLRGQWLDEDHLRQPDHDKCAGPNLHRQSRKRRKRLCGDRLQHRCGDRCTCWELPRGTSGCEQQLDRHHLQNGIHRPDPEYSMHCGCRKRSEQFHRYQLRAC